MFSSTGLKDGLTLSDLHKKHSIISQNYVHGARDKNQKTRELIRRE